MQRSLKEIGELTQRAGSGAELPSGLEVEVGAAVVWLEGRGLDGVEIAAACLQRYRVETEAERIGLIAGVDILDELLESQKLNPSVPAAWNEAIFSPAGLLPYAVKCSRRGVAIHLTWEKPGSASRGLALCAHGSLRLRFSDKTIMTSSDVYQTSIIISARPMAVSGLIPTEIVLDAWELDKRVEASVQNGMEVPDAAWARLTEFAARTLVADA